MILSACVFGYGPVGQKFVSEFCKLDGYDDYIRIHIVIVKDLKNHDDAFFTPYGQWKLRSQYSEDPAKGVSIGDDSEWLKSQGYLGHDVLIDCSWENENFDEEISDQLKLNPNFTLYTCKTLSKVDVLIEKLKSEIEYKHEQKLLKEKELKEKKLKKSKKDVPVKEEENLYKLALFNRKDFYISKKNDKTNFLDIDSDRIYENNSYNFRETKETCKTDIVYAGCSVTYGVGVSIENIWGNILAEKLGGTSTNMSKAGSSITEIVSNIYKYFHTFGHPKYLFCVFPDYTRYFFPVDGKFYKERNIEDAYVEYQTYHEKTGSFFSTIHYGLESFKGSYIKLPYDYKRVVSPDMGLYEATKDIRRLEQYCKATGIKLLWTTWEYFFENTILSAQNIENIKFDNFFALSELNNFYYVNKGLNNARKDIFYENKEKYVLCLTDHKDMVCECDSGCHQDLKAKYPDEFYSGTDVEAGTNSHFGSHWHAHVAEGFYNKVQELESQEKSARL